MSQRKSDCTHDRESIEQHESIWRVYNRYKFANIRPTYEFIDNDEQYDGNNYKSRGWYDKHDAVFAFGIDRQSDGLYEFVSRFVDVRYEL